MPNNQENIYIIARLKGYIRLKVTHNWPEFKKVHQSINQKSYYLKLQNDYTWPACRLEYYCYVEYVDTSYQNWIQYYLQIEEQIINKLADVGVYSFLDMHQDCMSSYFPPSYDGVPTWIIDLFPELSMPYPWPLDEITQWEQGYLTQGVSEAAQQLYNNTEGALEFWGRYVVFFKTFFVRSQRQGRGITSPNESVE